MNQNDLDCEPKSEFKDCPTKTEIQIESRVEANSETDGLKAFGFCDRKLVLKKNLNVHERTQHETGVRSCLSSPFSKCMPVLDWSE